MQASDVLSGQRLWSVEQADCLSWLQSLPADSVDLIMMSPPYSDARLYGELNFTLAGEDWVRWMVGILSECSRVCKGLIVCVCEGKTRDRRYDCTPYLLMADLHRAGFNLRKPCIYFRYPIPGGGQDDGWRNDYEPIICLSRPGKLPWADNTATGHPPKWAPGGEMSNRLTDGRRVNQWGGSQTSGTNRRRKGQRETPERPSHVVVDHDQTPGLFGVPAELPAKATKPATNRKDNGSRKEEVYEKPVLANPGNVLRAHYDAEEVRAIFADAVAGRLPPGDVIRCIVGGQQMGSPLAHENEAPYPESLVEPFVRCFCPPGGVAADCFSGSGTTGATAVRCGRRFIGCDLREGQVSLACQRIGGVTPPLPGTE